MILIIISVKNLEELLLLVKEIDIPILIDANLNVNVNVRRGKYEGTTRVSEREKREKEGLIFKISKKRREGEISSSTEKQPQEKEKKEKKNLSFLPPFPQKEKTHRYYFLPSR